MKYVEELIKLANGVHSKWRPTANDWAASESELGFKLPSDYKELVSAFGYGSFGYGIGLRNPLSRDFATLRRDRLRLSDGIMEEFPEERKELFYPEKGALVWMGKVGDGVNLFYRLNAVTREL